LCCWQPGARIFILFGLRSEGDELPADGRAFVCLPPVTQSSCSSCYDFIARKSTHIGWIDRRKPTMGALKNIRLATPLVATLFFVIALPGAAFGLDLRPQFDAPARRLIENRTAVGLVIGIFKNGETQVAAYGEVEKGSGIAPTGDTVYEIGSITKVFTGILLSDQIQRGMVRLDAPVQEYLPASVKVPVRDDHPITLQHLVTHTSGFPRRPENMKPRDRLNPYADYTVKQMYGFLDNYRPRRSPGQYEYSNFGMGLLGHALTLQANKTYEQLLVERICAPLGMQDTLPNPHPDMRKRLAPPYDDQRRPTRNWDLPTLAGAGGIRSTVSDMLKFIKANLGNDDTSLAKAIRLSHRRLYTMDNGKGIGSAWNISRNGEILFHGGSTGGYRAWMAIVPNRNLGIVVLANTTDARIYKFGDQLVHMAMGSSPSSGSASTKTADPDPSMDE
jgi:serine-type D-Ala-D-Ala carboxypeptidase/endopeptidase